MVWDKGLTPLIHLWTFSFPSNAYSTAHAVCVFLTLLPETLTWPYISGFIDGFSIFTPVVCILLQPLMNTFCASENMVPPVSFFCSWPFHSRSSVVLCGIKDSFLHFCGKVTGILTGTALILWIPLCSMDILTFILMTIEHRVAFHLSMFSLISSIGIL